MEETMTSDSTRLADVLRRIDLANEQDPNPEEWQGKSHPKALLYGQRMSAWLQTLAPDAPPMCLHAWRVEFRHPTADKPFAIEAPQPDWAF